MPKNRQTHSVRAELVRKSREAALCAIQVFNNPLVRFKSETYIVLMVIAWTYLLHAYYRKMGVEYRHREDKPGSRRKWKRTKYGRIMYWELERCLNAPDCPLDRDTVNNLRFLIGLRHEIEHEMIMNLDNWLSGRYQACAINYCEYVKRLFGEDQGLEQFLSYSLQFVKLSREQAEGMPIEDDIPARLTSYIAEFDAQLSPEEYNSPSFAYRLFFTPKAAGKIGQADSVVEFVPLGSSESNAIVERSLGCV